MRNIKLKLEYDGTDFFGWQAQKEGRTIQQTLEKAIEKLTGEKNIEVFGSSRTDSGVHAKAYIGNFHTASSIPAERFKEAINTKLPSDIVVLESEEMENGFHSRYMSTGKTYCYTILNRREAPVIGRNYVYSYMGPLDINAMKEACVPFIGRHDFEAFKSQGSSVQTSVRTITDLHIETERDLIKIYISADGFLYNMVRIIAGTLLRVGARKIKSEEILEIILSKDRTRAGKCAPARGLCLEEVFFGN
ncbi:tRNA pseudouridine(38-40) synthase TruA [uncultured Clostridium sp.]|jgi:tRNA pseudouridine38-40 synthase|uniref:tRNA pseudouridine(38-40) synthase TruA n=1 Tax=uncultured Clostridium sp. TaxID=59620 RepID=UPI002627BC44|nr:tRNA pseudouridine(38-40) synthase TruA [uncultured Clostridium sp.]